MKHTHEQMKAALVKQFEEEIALSILAEIVAVKHGVKEKAGILSI